MSYQEFSQLIRSFNTATMEGPRMERALHRIGMLISAKAKINSPIDLGALRNSIDYRVEMRKDSGIVTVGSYGVPYAAIQEFGGTIVAKKRFLTIPFASWAKHRRAGDFDLTFVKTPRGGMLIDARRIRSGQKDIPREAIGFLLRRSVTLRARPYIRPAVESSTERIVQILREIY